jgi:hypothetical protein
MINTKRIAWCVAFLAATVVLADLAQAQTSRSRMRARLRPGSAAGAQGKADWEQRSDRMRLSVEGEDLFAYEGQSVDIYIDGAFVSTQTVALGGFDLNLDTRDGDSVPTVANGSICTVQIGSDVLLTGTFFGRN